MSDSASHLDPREECVRELAALEERREFGMATADGIARLVATAHAVGDEGLLWRARRLGAELAGREGHLAEATKELWRVHAFASAHAMSQLLAQTHHNLSWNYRDIGDMTAHLEHAVQAVEQLNVDASPSIRALHLIRLAGALDECGSPDEARETYSEAEEFALRHGETVRQLSCLNNRAYGEWARGDIAAAQASVARLQAAAAAHKLPLDASTLDTIARIQTSAGHLDAAVETCLRATEVYRASGVPEVRGPAELLLTRAAAELARGGLDEAESCIEQARSLGNDAGLASLLTRAEEAQAELHAARGQWESAYRSYRAFHAAEKALVFEQHAAQSRLRLAVLGTAEARAEAELLRIEVVHDALTGLPNRRYLNEHLPRRMSERRPREVLAAALVDLDHFKRVNDTCSHAAGDEVLVAVSALLDQSVTRWRASTGGDGFAARMGGEEFLLVLWASQEADPLWHLEDLRGRTAQRDWSPIVGTLPVTMSIGLTRAVAHDTQFSLLRRADRLLYAAKDAGRNRVAVDGADSPVPADLGAAPATLP